MHEMFFTNISKYVPHLYYTLIYQYDIKQNIKVKQDHFKIYEHDKQFL